MNKGKSRAIKLREEIGFDDPFEVDIEDVVTAFGGLVQYKNLGSIDGRIVYGEKISTIYINSQIQYEGRKRFAIVHELGHLLMHKGSLMHDDSVNSLSWFNETEKQLKKGKQEFEANQFASEYLMPSDLFYEQARKTAFGPDLIRSLSERFGASLTSVAFKSFDVDIYPVAMFHIFNGKVKYWKRSKDFRGFLKNTPKLPPPEDSVAAEYIEANYRPIYKRNELAQQIYKSTWCELREGEQDSDFYEYCIVSQSHKSILSIIWEA